MLSGDDRDLSYTSIIAPITGRIGRSIASVGDLVGPTTGNLTTLVSIDPIEALFSRAGAAAPTPVGLAGADTLDQDGVRRGE